MLTVRRPTGNSNNVTTGAVTRTWDDAAIRRAVVLPATRIKDFVYDLTYVAANKNFTYGGFFNKQTRFIVIRRHLLRDAGKTWDINTDCKIVINNRQYDIQDVTDTEDMGAWLIKAVELESRPNLT